MGMKLVHFCWCHRAMTICQETCLTEYQRYWKLSAGFTCLLSCSIVCHGLLAFSKAHIHISKSQLYSHGAAGCHTPSCAGQSKTMGHKLLVKVFANYFIFSASGEGLCSKTCAVSQWQLHVWTPVLLHGEWTVAAVSSSSMSLFFHISCLFSKILTETITVLQMLNLHCGFWTWASPVATPQNHTCVVRPKHVAAQEHGWVTIPGVIQKIYR